MWEVPVEEVIERWECSSEEGILVRIVAADSHTVEENEENPSHGVIVALSGGVGTEGGVRRPTMDGWSGRGHRGIPSRSTTLSRTPSTGARPGKKESQMD